MPTIISFRDAEVVTGGIITRVETLERRTKSVVIDTSSFVKNTDIQGILNKALNGFVHNIEILLDSIPEGEGISHYKVHKFTKKTNFNGDLFVLTDNLFDIGSTSFAWKKLYCYEIDVDGNITVRTNGTANIGDSALQFNTVFAVNFRVGSGTASRPAKLDSGKNIISAPIDLSAFGVDVTNKLGIANGGVDADNYADARTNLDVYSKAEVDALIATCAQAGVQTGATDDGSGPHTHTQV